MANKNIKTAFVYENLNDVKELILPRTAALAVFMNDANGTSVEAKINGLSNDIINLNNAINNLDIDIPIDSILSTTSTNPVQNKVISSKLTDINDSLIDINDSIDDITSELNVRLSINGGTLKGALIPDKQYSSNVHGKTNITLGNENTSFYGIYGYNLYSMNIIPSSTTSKIGDYGNRFKYIYSKEIITDKITFTEINTSIGEGNIVFPICYKTENIDSPVELTNKYYHEIYFNGSTPIANDINTKYSLVGIQKKEVKYEDNIENTNYDELSVKWLIDKDGNARFNDIYITTENGIEELSSYIGRIVQSASSGEITYSTATSEVAGITKLYNNGTSPAYKNKTDGAYTAYAVNQLIGQFYDGEDIYVYDDLYVDYIANNNKSYIDIRADIRADNICPKSNNIYSLGTNDHVWSNVYSTNLILSNPSSTNYKKGTFTLEGLSRYNDVNDLWELSLKWKPVNNTTSINWIDSNNPDDTDIELMTIIPTQQIGSTSASDYGYNNRDNIIIGSVNSKLPIYISGKKVLTTDDSPSITKTGSCYIGYSKDNDFTYNLDPSKTIIEKSQAFRTALLDALNNYSEIIIVNGQYYLQNSPIEIKGPNKVIRGLGYNTTIFVPQGVPAFKITGDNGNVGGQGTTIKDLSICKCYNTLVYNNLKDKTVSATAKYGISGTSFGTSILIERNACTVSNINFTSIYTDLVPSSDSSIWTTGSSDINITLQFTGGNNNDVCLFDDGTSSNKMDFKGNSDDPETGRNSRYSRYGNISSIFINTIKYVENSSTTYTQANAKIEGCLFQDAYSMFDVFKNVWKSNGSNTTLIIGCTIGNAKKFRTGNVYVSGCLGINNKILRIEDNTSGIGYSTNTDQYSTNYINSSLAYIDTSFVL